MKTLLFLSVSSFVFTFFLVQVQTTDLGIIDFAKLGAIPTLGALAYFFYNQKEKWTMKLFDFLEKQNQELRQENSQLRSELSDLKNKIVYGKSS